MKKELELELVKKYPSLLRDFGGNPMQTCMAWGFEHADGWYKILDHLFSYLYSLMNTDLVISYKKDYRDAHKGNKDYYEKYYSYRIKPPQITISQVKEKYGTLTVYYHANSEDFQDLSEEVREILDEEDYDKKIKRFYNKVDFAINYAEYQSSITCEETGKDGRLYTRGWHRTMCDEIAIKNGYNPEDASKEGIKWEEL
jgi:hypothetical protein